MKDVIGYSVTALFRSSRGIDPEKARGRSSRTSAATAVVKKIEIAIPKAQQDTGDASLMGPPNRAAEALQVDQHKYPGDGSNRTCSVMVFSFLKIQATSHKLQAPSSKHQAPSHKLQAPRSENHGKVSSTLNRGAGPR
mgnify:FL=1